MLVKDAAGIDTVARGGNAMGGLALSSSSVDIVRVCQTPEPGGRGGERARPLALAEIIDCGEEFKA